ncbi:MAG: ribosome-binding factor A [bacterium]|nr:ribosome-binding factor A [bacterium]
MAYQKERFSSFLEHEMADFFSREAAGFLPEGAFISVTRAVISESGEIADIYILIFPEGASKDSFAEIRKLGKEARKYISEKLKRRQIPKISIKLDNGTDKAVRVEKLLDSAVKE